MATLARIDGGEPMSLFPDHGFGREAPATTVIDDSHVSRQHAIVRWTGKAWAVRDLNSNNGTYVDGQRLLGGAEAPIRAGSIVRFGPPVQSYVVLDDRAPNVVASSSRGELRYGSPFELAIDARFAVERACDPNSEEHRCTWALTDLAGAGEVRFVRNRTKVEAGDEVWELHLPAWTDDTDAQESARTHDFQGEGTGLAEGLLEIERTKNWSYIRGRISLGGRSIDLGDHSYMEMLHLLARRSADDEAAGRSDPGWVFVDDLAHDLKWERRRLNVEVWRLRQATLNAGVLGGRDIVVRRVSTAEIRLGIGRVTVRVI